MTHMVGSNKYYNIPQLYPQSEEIKTACNNGLDREIKLKEIGNQLVVYLIVRKELRMSVGKIAGQCGHAIHYLTSKYYKSGSKAEFFCERMRYWEDNDFHTKIVLAASDKEWEKLKEEYDPIIVIDAGKTEIKSGSETVIVLWPMLKDERSKILKKLQLL